MTSRTQASYDDSHVERVRLVRALTSVAGLSIATVRQVLETAGDPADVMGTAQRALYGRRRDPEGEGGAAHALVKELGWSIEIDDPVLVDLDRALQGMEAGEIGVGEEQLRAYAEQMLAVARLDVATVPPGDPGAAVRQVVLGTVLVEPVLLALRRLAHQHVATGG
ncbi:MerR family transcriptional regulator [Marihabitans asiaticum]|uniref:MerR family transcriptional regulator n=1 Tax=Marihabitans asiaticum TaxID=415218 RepID=UPI001FEC43D2|nr:MerR family transcriptional regulator [Marihabitans asiaticum]